jgi:hypothetical protein
MSRGHTLLTTLKFSCEMASRKVSRSGFDGLADTMFKVWESSLGAEMNKAHIQGNHQKIQHSKSYENGFLGFDFSTLTTARSGTSHLTHSSSAPILRK